MTVKTSEVNLVEEAEAVREHRGSLYYRLLECFPGLEIKYFPGPEVFHDTGQLQKRQALNLIPYYLRAKERGDGATARDLEDVFHHVTSVDDYVIAAMSSLTTIVDPVGAVCSYFTGKKTLGGFSLLNKSMDGETLFTPQSGYTRAGKVSGYVVGALAWLVVPVATTVAAGALAAIDGLLLRSQRTNK